jgi:hypothetical protein
MTDQQLAILRRQLATLQQLLGNSPAMRVNFDAVPEIKCDDDRLDAWGNPLHQDGRDA